MLYSGNAVEHYGHSTVLIGPSKACLVIMILRVHVLNNMAE